MTAAALRHWPYASPRAVDALDDPDLAPWISTWRRPCGHSQIRNQWRHDNTGEPLVYFLGET